MRERDLARRKAREAESTLAKLRDAGVNVARLSGERPTLRLPCARRCCVLLWG